jgi:sirohydrochlorin cobaltochelatase
MSTTGIILYAHGARDSDWAAPFHAIAARVRTRLPGIPVSVAFLEYMPPRLDDALCTLRDSGVDRVLLLPLFWGRGRHLKSDLPALVASLRERHPELTIVEGTAAGDSPVLQEAIAAWIAETALRGGAGT